MRYCVRRDDDAHYYLVPVDKADEFERWVTNVTLFWECGANEAKYDIEPAIPKGCKMIDGIHRLAFENPVEE